MLKIKISAILIFTILLYFKATLPIFASYGDGNNDGQVDGQDFIIWLTHFDQSIFGTSNGDYDESGKVEIGDYVVWINTYNTEPPPTPTNTPTPAPSGAPTPPSTASCLDRNTGNLITTRSNINRSLADNDRIDASAISWIDQGDNPVKIGENVNNICFHGGYIEGNYPLDEPWETTHGANAFSVYSVPSVTIEDLRIENHGDGIKLRETATKNFLIRGVYMHDMRDDCIEHDWLQSGTIEDSLLDGCYVTFAARSRSGDSVDGSGNVWVIRNTLAYLRDQIGVYKGVSPGHGLFFKLNSDGKSPQIELHNNIFRLDSNNTCCDSAHDILPARGTMKACSNNIMVWLGNGSYPGILGNDPSTGEPCFTITTDKTVWDNAVAVWKTEHGF